MLSTSLAQASDEISVSTSWRCSSPGKVHGVCVELFIGTGSSSLNHISVLTLALKLGCNSAGLTRTLALCRNSSWHGYFFPAKCVFSFRVSRWCRLANAARKCASLFLTLKSAFRGRQHGGSCKYVMHSVVCALVFCRWISSLIAPAVPIGLMSQRGILYSTGICLTHSLKANTANYAYVHPNYVWAGDFLCFFLSPILFRLWQQKNNSLRKNEMQCSGVQKKILTVPPLNAAFNFGTCPEEDANV